MKPSPEQIKNSLFALTTKGIKYDLDRIRAASERIGNPQNGFPSIHVAGTNGKGSTCAFIEGILRSAGYTTGLFTSPHIVHFEERFRINGKPVEEEEWVDVYFCLKDIVAAYRLTFFEATMLMAAEIFKRHRVDYGIFETGLGGRLDATNILSPKVSVITHIAMDHADYLGSTLIEVAREKCGIIKNEIPLIAEEPSEPDIREQLLATCREKSSECVFVNGTTANYRFDSGMSTSHFTYDGSEYMLKMSGRYQVVNAICAIEAVRRCGCTLDEKTIQDGIGNTALRCRFETFFINDKTILFDVAHNPDAAKQLCTTLRDVFPSEKICFIAGIMKDKDYPAMLAEYSVIAHHIICTQPATERAASSKHLSEKIQKCEKSEYPDVGEAIEAAFMRSEKVICITGSFYTVGEALTSLRLNVTS